MILKCIGRTCRCLLADDDDEDHDNILVPEPAADANNGVLAHKREEITKTEKSRCSISSACWQRIRIIVKWKKRKNKDLGKQPENVSNEESQFDEMQGIYRKEASFNLGVGFGLVYHSAAFRNELNKMKELRGQMQRILQNVENALSTKNINPISPMKKLVSYHLDVSSSSNQGAEESRTTFVCDNYHDCETTTQERFSEGMDQLEEELEAELEQLQIHLDTEIMLKHKDEGKLQMNVIETASDGLSQSGRRYKEVVIDHPEAEEEIERNGVCPTELERRLHELVESRQEERIKELETALEIAKHKLCEKEREVCWWKNTASIISKHVPEPSSFLHTVGN